MPSAGLSVKPECIETYNELKLKSGKGGPKYIIYRISDDQKEIVVDEAGTETEWDIFREKILSKKDDKGKPRPSFAVYDLQFELEGGEGTRNKIVFLTYMSESSGIKPKMVYASSRETLKNALSGHGMDWQANDDDEMEYTNIVKVASKGKAT